MYVSFESLPDHSRIWIYQCSRQLSDHETVSIGEETKHFLENWTSHNQAVMAGFEVRYHRFLILLIDEKVAGAGGCSIDKSVHFIQSLERKYGVSFLDRLKFAYKNNGKAEVVTRDQFNDLYSRGILTDGSIVFNNLVTTKKDLRSGWEVALRESWHKDLLGV